MGQAGGRFRGTGQRSGGAVAVLCTAVSIGRPRHLSAARCEAIENAALLMIVARGGDPTARVNRSDYGVCEVRRPYRRLDLRGNSADPRTCRSAPARFLNSCSPALTARASQCETATKWGVRSQPTYASCLRRPITCTSRRCAPTVRAQLGRVGRARGRAHPCLHLRRDLESEGHASRPAGRPVGD